MLSNITINDIKEIFTVFSPNDRFAKIENRKSFGLSFFASTGKLHILITGTK